MHFNLLLITNGDIDEALDPFFEGASEDIDDWKWDFWTVGGRWYGRIEATRGEHGHIPYGLSDPEGFLSRRTGYDVVKLRDASIDPEMFYSVLTPDGVWHDCETYDYESREFVKDPDFYPRFIERFVEPYLDYTAYMIDYHI